jgi:hypothetical protein
MSSAIYAAPNAPVPAEVEALLGDYLGGAVL